MKLNDRLDEIEEMLNWVSDQDREWWPFLFLRPEQHERLGSRRVLLLSLLHGIFVGMLANVLIAFVASADARPNVLAFPFFTTLGFFAFYRLTFAYFWNRRARRLSATNADAL